MKRRSILVAAFAALAVAAFLSTRSQAEPNQVKYVAAGVWFREGDLDGLGHCNNIIIEMKDYLIVVDANFPSNTSSTRTTTATTPTATPSGPRPAPPPSPTSASPRR